MIIPVHAAEPASVDLLGGALHHLNASTYSNFEILVVDDGSPDPNAVRSIVMQAGAGWIRLDRRMGPAAARNAAADKAAGDVLVFMDADTSARPDTLACFAAEFQSDPGLDAVIGSYDQRPTAPGLVSRFRNLLHSFVHHSSRSQASTFWTGCGAVRKERFQALGGFDESFSKPSMEDVEFGLRLSKAGGCIKLNPQIEVTHHKAWTLCSMIRTDLLSRAIPWAGLLGKHALPLDLNFKLNDRVSVALMAITLLTTVIAVIHGGAWRMVPLAAASLIALLNWRLFGFLARAGSRREAVSSFPLFLVYLTTCIVGLLCGLALAEHRRDRFFWRVVAATGVVLLMIQISGGAFQAEFTGHPDEAAHFVSGLMIHDFLANPPWSNPIAWAGQYYLHYPKVAIGHWPPAYHTIEALWWLVLGPSRVTAMLLQWLIGVVALTALYRLSRSFLPLPISVAIAACAVATPIFQQSLQQTMADLCCLLWAVLFMHATVRLVKRQDGTAVFLVVFWLFIAALTKGTAVCLVPVPLVALLASRQPIRIPLGWLAAAGAGLLAAGAWYLSMGGIRDWAGMYSSVPLPHALIGHVAGWGFLGLAILGVRRHPLALVAASVIICTLGVSFVVRAMREERHWMMTLPAILLLAGFAIHRFRNPLAITILLAAAIAFFPFSRYHQSPTEYGGLLRQLRTPARMLVSSSSAGEGAWVAVTSLSEPRPSSLVARASKVLVEEGWSGEGYHLLTPTQEAVSRRIDELALDIVVLNTPLNVERLPHHVLLQDTVSHSPAWKPCGSARDLVAYCRTRVPQVPRQPLRLRLNGWDFTEQIER